MTSILYDLFILSENEIRKDGVCMWQIQHICHSSLAEWWLAHVKSSLRVRGWFGSNAQTKLCAVRS